MIASRGGVALLILALGRRALRSHEGDVVLLLPVAPDELSQLGEALVDEVLASAAVLDDPLEPWKAEHLSGGIVCLGEAVAVEQDTLTRNYWLARVPRWETRAPVRHLERCCGSWS